MDPQINTSEENLIADQAQVRAFLTGASPLPTLTSTPDEDSAWVASQDALGAEAVGTLQLEARGTAQNSFAGNRDKLYAQSSRRYMMTLGFYMRLRRRRDMGKLDYDLTQRDLSYGG